MHHKPLLLLSISALIGLSGCVTSRSIRNDIDTTESQAYHDWQRQQAVADTLPANREVNPEDYHVKQDQQPVVKGKLELSDAVKLALIYNRNIQTAVENTTYAHGRILEAYGGVAPTATLNGSYTRPDKVTAFSINGNRIQLGYFNNYSTDLRIEQPIIDGAAATGLRAAKLYDALVDKQVQSATQNVVYQVEQSYYQLLLLQKTFNVNKQFLQVSRASLKNVQNQAKFGTATQFNVLRAQVDVANANTQMITSQNDFEQAEAAFFKLLGISQHSQVTFQDSLNYKKMNVSESKAVDIALHNNPDLASSLLNVRLNEANVAASYAKYLPTLSAYFDQTYAKPDPHVSQIDEWGYAWNVGLTLKWNLFDLSREGTIIQNKSQLRQQRLSYLDEQEQVLYNVRSAILALKNAERSVNAQKLTLQQAQEGLRLSQAEFKNGTIDQVSVLDARQALRQAELSYYTSLYDHNVARLQLLKATGQIRIKKASSDNSESKP